MAEGPSGRSSSGRKKAQPRGGSGQLLLEEDAVPAVLGLPERQAVDERAHEQQAPSPSSGDRGGSSSTASGSKPSPSSSTLIRHTVSSIATSTWYASWSPACWTTLAHASVSASRMSSIPDAATPRCSRACRSSPRTSGTLCASTGNRTLNAMFTAAHPLEDRNRYPRFRSADAEGAVRAVQRATDDPRGPSHAHRTG